MKKPNSILLKLVNIGVISSLVIDYRQTGTDTAETYCTINGKLKGLWRTYKPYLNVGVDYNSVAHVKPNFLREYDGWKEFEKNNRQELKEYERLKNKFEK